MVSDVSAISAIREIPCGSMEFRVLSSAMLVAPLHPCQRLLLLTTIGHRLLFRRTFATRIPEMSDIYSFKVSSTRPCHGQVEDSLAGQVEQPKRQIPLADYKDKTLLLVNVASKCGESKISTQRLSSY